MIGDGFNAFRWCRPTATDHRLTRRPSPAHLRRPCALAEHLRSYPRLPTKGAEILPRRAPATGLHRRQRRRNDGLQFMLQLDLRGSRSHGRAAPRRGRRTGARRPQAFPSDLCRRSVSSPLGMTLQAQLVVRTDEGMVWSDQLYGNSSGRVLKHSYQCMPRQRILLPSHFTKITMFS